MPSKRGCENCGKGCAGLGCAKVSSNIKACVASHCCRLEMAQMVQDAWNPYQRGQVLAGLRSRGSLGRGSPHQGCIEAAGAHLPGHSPWFPPLKAPNTSFCSFIIKVPICPKVEGKASLISYVWLRELSELYWRETLFIPLNLIFSNEELLRILPLRESGAVIWKPVFPKASVLGLL